MLVILIFKYNTTKEGDYFVKNSLNKSSLSNRQVRLLASIHEVIEQVFVLQGEDILYYLCYFFKIHDFYVSHQLESH